MPQIAHAQVFSYTFTGAEPSGPDRQFRDGVPSVAGSPKAFPGTLANPTTFFYLQPIVVPVGGTVTVTQLTGNFSIFLALYRDSFNPLDLSANYAADTGGSGNAETLGFTNSGGSTSFLVVMMNVAPADSVSVQAVSGNYQVDIVSTAPEPSSLALVALAGGLVLARRRRGVRAGE